LYENVDDYVEPADNRPQNDFQEQREDPQQIANEEPITQNDEPQNYNHHSEPEPAFQAPVYDEPAYNEPPVNEQSFNEPAFNEPAYNEPAPNEPAFNASNVPEQGFNEPAYNEPAAEPEFHAPDPPQVESVEPAQASASDAPTGATTPLCDE